MGLAELQRKLRAKGALREARELQRLKSKATIAEAKATRAEAKRKLLGQIARSRNVIQKGRMERAALRKRQFARLSKSFKRTRRKAKGFFDF